MTSTGSKQFKVRDKRKSNRYYVDNEFLNGYAKYVGWRGQVVYHALCRHAKNGKCFPGQDHLAIELGISISSVKRGIKELKEWDIIGVDRRRRTQSNEYWLLDRSEWKTKPEQRWSNRPKKER
ncbi:helix-turn-helix domain-containing protein [Patescibacteria group bacterium]